jgi:Domain of unknown function (DUF4337)
MEAHRSYERFERGHEVAAGNGHPTHAATAAFVVAVMAAFLALAGFLSNEAVKEVVTGETHRADATAQLETNRVKADVAGGNADLLRVLSTGGPATARAAASARAHEARIVDELKPTDTRLQGEIAHHEHEVSDADTQHVDYELAEVGIEVGIVLATVSIIARRRWLLGAGGAAATAGVVLLVVGLLV